MPGSLNVGESQDRLDDIAAERVEVTPLAPAECATPHLELLCYCDRFAQHGTPARTNDRAATQLIFTIEVLKRWNYYPPRMPRRAYPVRPVR
jgi:hypothetical protein